MIIGLVGSIGSGKGTIGDILVNRHNFRRESFAKSLKDAASAIFGWDRALLEGDTDVSRLFREQKDEYWSVALNRDITPRLVLQLLGTEAGRQIFGKDLWVSSVERRIQQQPHDNYVITDARFENEIQKIRDMGGVIIRVVRGEKPEFEDTATNNPSQMPILYPHIHASEYEWMRCKFDIEYFNGGTLFQLAEDIENLLDSINSLQCCSSF
jgi:hypothetical protein